MLHKSTIKAEVKKQFSTVDVINVSFKGFGVFVVKVKQEKPKSTKTGILLGNTDFDKKDNGVILENKITWL